MPIRIRVRRAAFTLIELLLVVAIIALLISILLPALSKSRNAARIAICTSNMRQLAVAEATYAADYKDRIGALNWAPGKVNGDSVIANVPAGTSWLTTQGRQAKDIVFRLQGKDRPAVLNRFFNRNFWHLAAVDGGYFGAMNCINPTSGCPSDDWVLRWQKNEDNYAALVGSSPEPSANPSGAYEWYRPYWSSYQLVPVAFAPDKHKAGSLTLSQVTDRHHLFNGGSGSPVLGQRTVDEVAFPSQKVFIFDIFDRHSYRRPIWHAHTIASQPLAFFDSSVRFLKTRDSRPGWNPDTVPTNPNTTPPPTVYQYNPSTGFPGYDHPTLTGVAFDTVTGYFRWTRDGLRGYDYR